MANILPNILIYDIAILIHFKDNKFCKIDIQDICQIADDALNKFRPLTMSSDDLNVHTALRHDLNNMTLKIFIIGVFRQVLLALICIFILVALNVSRRVYYILATCYTFTFSCFIETLFVGAGIFADIGKPVNCRRCFSSL